jgi:drug/metabolite transporter (DMT)-like permease
MGIQLMLLAALFVAASNLCMRKSIDAGGSSKAFLAIQLFIVFLVAILLNPVRTGKYEWSSCMAGFGLSGGIVLGAMMAALGKSVEKGPPGLSFAMLSSATVMPAIIMAFIFGSSFGYVYHWWNGLGSLIVVAGLFWAGWETTQRSQQMKKWLFFGCAAFLLHAIFLVFMQWRALFINFPGENGLFLSFDVDDAINQWFMPMVFLAASFMQMVSYASSEKKLPKKKEYLFGVLGGIVNGVGTFFMIYATEVSNSWEHATIFPIFSVALIIFCNLWGQWLYREKVNWRASALCLAGILIATLDWPRLLK